MVPVSPKLAVCLVSVELALLGAYSFFQPGVLEPSRCQQPGADCVDQVVQLTHHAHVTQLLPGAFVVLQWGGPRPLASNLGFGRC